MDDRSILAGSRTIRTCRRRCTRWSCSLADLSGAEFTAWTRTSSRTRMTSWRSRWSAPGVGGIRRARGSARYGTDRSSYYGQVRGTRFVSRRTWWLPTAVFRRPGLKAELAALQQVPLLRDLLWTGPVARAPHGVELTQVEPEAADEAIAEIAKLERDLAAPARAGRVLGRLVMVLGILADGRVDRQPVEQGVHSAVAATIARFEAALAEPWRLDEVAAAVNLDPAYLSRLFRRHTGLSPLGFLARLRAERAATLLAQTDLPAARVGAAVGWDDPTYFARRFRSLVGSTPTEYRRRTGVRA